jgi:titin
VKEGQKVIFECEVTGIPLPTIKWYHDNSEIKHSPDFNITLEYNACRLVIAEVFSEDAGQYTCTAINPAGSKSTFCYLRVEPG